MSEKSFSSTFKNKIRKEFFVLDLEEKGNGIPDSMILNPLTKKYLWMEYKDKGGKLTPYQVAWMTKNPREFVYVLEKESKSRFNLYMYSKNVLYIQFLNLPYEETLSIISDELDFDKMFHGGKTK